MPPAFPAGVDLEAMHAARARIARSLLLASVLITLGCSGSSDDGAVEEKAEVLAREIVEGREPTATPTIAGRARRAAGTAGTAHE